MTQQQQNNAFATLNDIHVANASLKKKHWYDALSAAMADFLTSTFIIMVIMLIFLAGIASHIKLVFDSWFLAIGFQSVVLLTSVSSDMLPKYRNVPIIAACMSCLTASFVFLSFDGHLSEGVMLVVNILKSIAIAGVEFIFAYLFVARNNREKAERQGVVFGLNGEVLDAKTTEQFEHVEHAEHVNMQEQPSQNALQEEHAEQTEHDEIQAQSTTEPAVFKCDCGDEFASKEELDKHVDTCPVHQWLKSKRTFD